MNKGEKMKKGIVLILVMILLCGCFAGCNTAGMQSGEDGRLKIVATIFPEYDWVVNILGDNPGNADVTLLLDKGVDLHSYQPTAADILTVSTCDVFIYVGGESDEWVEDVFKEAVNKDMTVINLLDVLGDSVKEEEIAEGMQAEEEETEETSEETEYDEHVWLSLKNASVFVKSISEAVQSKDPEHADVYKTNAEAYTDKLNNLDLQYRTAVSEAKGNTLLFGDRFPFRYLTDDYNLTYYAAFAGCSAETEASFETITFLAGKMDELSLPAVMTIEGSDGKIAETIIRNTKDKNQKILTMDSMQAATKKDVESGMTYLSVMEKNLEVLKEALQ